MSLKVLTPMVMKRLVLYELSLFLKGLPHLLLKLREDRACRRVPTPHKLRQEHDHQ